MKDLELSPPSLSLSGKTALVTGGTRGIGAATAEAMAELGASVTVVARDQARTARRVAKWQQRGLDISGSCADLSDPRQRDLLFESLGLSKLDILVNNVGTNLRKSALDYSVGEYETILATNLRAAWEFCRFAHPLLSAGEDAAIVNVSSVAALGHLGTGIPYGMSKAAMLQMTRGLAVEWAADGIRVNAVLPWYTDTPLARSVLDNPDYLAAVVQRTPMKRIASAREVACAIVFLSSASASFISGQCLAVDGGFSALAFDPPAV